MYKTSFALLLLAACGGSTNPSGGDALPDAGSCAWQGDVQFGTSGADALVALVATPAGIAAGGYLNGVNHEQNIEPSGPARGFVRSFSLTGTQLWETSFETSATDTVDALAVSADGGIVAAGRTTGALPGFTNQGQQDAFVATLTPGGSVQTVVQFGDERPQHPKAVAFGPAGIVVGGYEDTYVPTNFVEDFENPFFATIASGAPVAAMHSDRTVNPDFAYGLAVDPGGDVFLSGVRTTGADKGFFVRRQSPSGALVWSVRVSTTGLEIPGPIIAATDGTIWVAGSWLRSTPTSDLALLHLDATTGAILDKFDFPTADSAEEVNALVRDRHGDFWLAGSTVGSFPGSHSAGQLDALVLHVSPQGVLLDSWQTGTAADDQGFALAIDACDHVILGGSTGGGLVSSVSGQTDAFLLRVPLAIRG